MRLRHQRGHDAVDFEQVVLGHSELRAKSSPPERGAVPCRSAGPQVRSHRLALPTVFEVELDLLAFDDLLQL
jgi:hypothetical protein